MSQNFKFVSHSRMFSTKKDDEKADSDEGIKINISQKVEKSTYKGPPLFEPRIPEPYKVKRFKADPEDSRLQKAGSFLRFAVERFFVYLQDIIFFRRDPVVFKTTQFIGRNVRRTINVLKHIWHELKHVGHGFKKLGKDVVIAGKLEGKDFAHQYKDKEYFEAQKVKQVK